MRNGNVVASTPKASISHDQPVKKQRKVLLILPFFVFWPLLVVVIESLSIDGCSFYFVLL